MKKMKTITTAAAVLALSATLAIAGPHEGKNGKGGKHGRGEFGQRFFAKLNLTDAQKTQVRDLSKSFREQNRVFFEQAQQTRRDFKAAKQAGDTARAEALKGTMQSQRAEMKSRHETLTAQILTVLTPEQRAQYETMKAERQARHKQRGDRGNRQQRQ